MKNIVLLILSLWMSSARGQEIISMTRDSLPMSRGIQPAYQMVVPQNALKDVSRDWKKYIAKGVKGSATEVEGEVAISGINNPNIGPGLLTLYSKLFETGTGVRISAWVMGADSAFLNVKEGSDQYISIEKYLHDFAVEEYKESVGKELKAEQQTQKDLENELDKLFKQEDKAHSNISQSERSIQNLKSDITTLNNDIEASNTKIAAQKKVVDQTASDKDANKEAQKTLKGLENEKKKFEKNIDNNHKNIDKENASIREEERNITDLKQQQSLKSEEIENQKKKVAEVQTKLDGIK